MSDDTNVYARGCESSHWEAEPRRQGGSCGQKPAQFPVLIASSIHGRPRRYPVPPANHETFGYHRKITYVEAHIYPAIHASRVGTRIVERRCSFLVATLLEGQAYGTLRGKCVSLREGERGRLREVDRWKIKVVITGMYMVRDGTAGVTINDSHLRRPTRADPSISTRKNETQLGDLNRSNVVTSIVSLRNNALCHLDFRLESYHTENSFWYAYLKSSPWLGSRSWRKEEERWWKKRTIDSLRVNRASSISRVKF